MKKITTLLIVLFISCNAFAQFNYYWDNTFQYTVTAGYSNEARQIATDAAGNIFILADVRSDIDSANHPGPVQYYVVLRKYTPAGALTVQKIVNVRNMQVSNTFDYKSAFALRIDGSGNVFIGYNFYNNSGANYDVCVSKYNNALSSAWTSVYSTPANETGVDLTLRSGIPFLLFKSVSGANTTYVVSKPTSSSSTPSALYSFDANLDVVNSITTTPTRNLYFTGSRLVSGAKVVMTASVNTTGGLKWKTLYNNSSVTGDDVGEKVIVGNDGFVYVAGTSYVNASNNNDALVLRFNSANGTQNARLVLNYPIGSASNNKGSAIIEGTGGAFFLATTRGNTDVVVYKLSGVNGVTATANANYLVTPLSFNSLTSLTISDIKVASSNNVYVCGSLTATSATGNFSGSFLAKYGMSASVFSLLDNLDVNGDNTDNFQGVGIALDQSRNNIIRVSNYWLNYASHIKENIRIEDFSTGSLRLGSTNDAVGTIPMLFPNPASGSIQFSDVVVSEPVMVFDLSGKLIANLMVKNNSLNISGITSGVYIFKVITPEGQRTQKIQIQ